MPRPRRPICKEVLETGGSMLEHFNYLVDVCARITTGQKRAYVNQRLYLMEAFNDTHNYGLFPTVEIKVCSESGTRYGYLIWKYGRLRNNLPQSIRSRGTPITHHIRRANSRSDYSRRDFKAVMPFASKWEVELTMSFEAELRPLRRYLEYLNTSRKTLLRPPPFPKIPDGGPYFSSWIQGKLDE